MATRSNKPGGILPALLIGIGAFLLVVALMLPLYLVPRMKVTPLFLGNDEYDGSLTITGVQGATLLDSKAYTSQKPTENNRNRSECKKSEKPAEGDEQQADAAGGEDEAQKPRTRLPMSCFMRTEVPVKAQRFVTAVDPSDENNVTFQASISTWRDDLGPEEGLLSASIDRITYDRKSALPVGEDSTLQPNANPSSPDSPDPVVPFKREGLQYKFPFGVNVGDEFPYFDMQALQTNPIKGVEETEVNGQDAVVFKQQVGPANLYHSTAKLLADKDGKLSDPDKLLLAGFRFNEPGYTWGIDSDEPVTMDRYYTVDRTITVSKVTGQILVGDEKVHMFFARDDRDAQQFVESGAAEKERERPTRTALVYNGRWDQDTIDRVATSNTESVNSLQTAQKTAPIILGILGILSLIVGVVLGSRRQRRFQEQTAGTTYYEYDENYDDGHYDARYDEQQQR